ncbi:type II secretion system protein [Vibrio hippocampi]|uniref:MSHA biogenesis protein MshA n=1 Tax=Vibrio hippocampi TaxID=654686 RepID=A0ABN8DIA0_9VIBR|nr:type II secretion system protein [Vibrio hippocampi]CAH0525510.1 hypothetical protein VHP8226_01035 [Vibrio hippocampi]
MKKQNGFTLIELVIVIVILGVLSATVAPKFLGIHSGARESVLKGAVGAIKGADGIVYGKSVIAGRENLERSEIKSGKNIIEAAFGHIFNTKINLKNAVNFDGVDVTELVNSMGDDYTVISFGKWKDTNTCHVKIYQDLETGELEFELVNEGC